MEVVKRATRSEEEFEREEGGDGSEVNGMRM
jgi:hypothetical protein